MNPAENKSLIDMPNEVWVDIIDYEKYYSVSNMGRIKSHSKNKDKIKAQWFNGTYYTVCLYRDKIQNTKLVQILVWESFNKKKKPNENVVTHINNISSDNMLLNLKLSTQSESLKTAAFIGNMPHLHENNMKKGHKWNELTGTFEDGVLVSKICSRCFIEKPIAEFPKNMVINFCSKCRNKASTEQKKEKRRQMLVEKLIK